MSRAHIPIFFVRHGESANNTLMEELGFDRKRFELERHMDAPLTAHGELQIAAASQRVAQDLLAGLNDAGRDTEGAYTDVLITTSYFHRALKTAEGLHRSMPGSHVAVWRDIHEVGGHYRKLTPAEMAAGKAQSSPSSQSEYRGAPGRTTEDVRKEFPSFTVEDDCPTGWFDGRETKESHEEAVQRCRHLTERLTHEVALAERGEVRPTGGFTRPLRAIVVVTHGDFFRLWATSVFGHDTLEGYTRTGTFVKTPEGKLVVPNTAVTVVSCEPPKPMNTTPTDAASTVVAREGEREEVAKWHMILFNCAAHLNALS